MKTILFILMLVPTVALSQVVKVQQVITHRIYEEAFYADVRHKEYFLNFTDTAIYLRGDINCDFTVPRNWRDYNLKKFWVKETEKDSVEYLICITDRIVKMRVTDKVGRITFITFNNEIRQEN